METFKLQSLSDWHPITPGEAIEFPAQGARQVRLGITCNDPVEVWVSAVADPAHEVLAAFQSGSFAVEFTAPGDALVRFVADADTAIFARGFAPDHRVAARDLPSFTTIAPRSRRNSDMDRMLLLMRLNEKAREDRYAADLARMKAALKAAPQSAAPAPSSAPPAASDASGVVE